MAVELSMVAQRMKDVIECRSHKVLLRKYNDCFRGQDAVDFLLRENVCYNETDAVTMFCQLVSGHFIARVATVTLSFDKGTQPLFSRSGLYKWEAANGGL